MNQKTNSYFWLFIKVSWLTHWSSFVVYPSGRFFQISEMNEERGQAFQTMQKELKPHSNSGRLPLLRRGMHPPMAECHVINCAVGHQFAITHDVFSWYIKYLSRHCKIWHASTTLGQRNTPIVGSRRQSPLVIITRLYTCTYMDPLLHMKNQASLPEF